jgi:hypothetical protein
VWEDEGPMPILNKSRVLMLIKVSNLKQFTHDNAVHSGSKERTKGIKSLPIFNVAKPLTWGDTPAKSKKMFYY